MSEKVQSLKERVLDLIKEIEEDTELAFAPEIAQVKSGLNSAQKWLENFSQQPPVEAPVQLEKSAPEGYEQPAENSHVAEDSEKLGE